MFDRSLRIGRIGKTDVRLHWSLLFGCAVIYAITPATGASHLVVATTVMLSIFASIALHEFGHMLVARRLGYPTRRIVLWMLGGVAILERVPRRTRDQVLIYAAGPLVNLIIAGLLVGLGAVLTALVVTSRNIALARWLYAPLVPPLSLVQFGGMAIVINLVLALFNLLPIYPLDGGRILRAALTPLLGERRADLLALLISALIAGGLLIIFGLQRDWLSVGEALLLLVVAGTLNPWFNRQISQAIMWWFHRGSYYAFIRQDYERALAYADTQIARGWRLGEHYILRSYVLLKTGDLAAAWLAADRAVQLCSTPGAQQAMALNNRGAIAWLRGDDTDSARRDVEQAILADPTLAHAYSSRGEIAAAQGETDQALADLTTAIELAPGLSAPRYHRAALRFRLGDLDGSRADAAYVFAFEQSEMLTWSEEEQRRWLTDQLAWVQQVAAWGHEHACSAGRVQGFLGDALWVNGRTGEAASAYTQALVVAPNDATLLFRRAQAHRAAGAIDAARADIERALGARPTPWIRKRALALLATLTPTATVLADDRNLPTALGETEQGLGEGTIGTS